MWQILDPYTTSMPRARFGGTRLGLHDFDLLGSVVYAETETEVESTSAISNEVRSLSQHLQKELVWPEKSFGEDLWDLVARHNPDDA